MYRLPNVSGRVDQSVNDFRIENKKINIHQITLCVCSDLRKLLLCAAHTHPLLFAFRVLVSDSIKFNLKFPTDCFILLKFCLPKNCNFNKRLAR